jgi:O-succinylbenzoic acid--CoA ligase
MNDVFLSSATRSVHFEEVRQLAERLHAAYGGISLLGIHFPQAEDTAIAIAAAWHAGIPFTVFPFAVEPDTVLNVWPVIDGIPLAATPNPDWVYTVVKTSGTSGDPKSVRLKRRQMISAASASAVNLRPDAGKGWVLSLPMHHVGGMSVVLRSWLYGTRVIVGEPVKAMRENPDAQVVSMVTPQLVRLLEDRDFEPHSGFKGVLLGGGRIPPELIRRCVDRNIPVISSFGMTETNGQIIAVPMDRWRDAPEGTSGRVFEPNEARIVDGVLEVRGAQLWDDDWYSTGDYARMDADGWIWIETRRTDRIVTGGENVDPEPVEEALRRLVGVMDAAVVGIDDPVWGQRVEAVIIARDGLFDRTLLSELKKVLPAYAVPKFITRTVRLPKTDNGKLKRAEIRQWLLDEGRGEIKNSG